jgi:eukaryotic-like serine/threonine-protein kinase
MGVAELRSVARRWAARPVRSPLRVPPGVGVESRPSGRGAIAPTTSELEVRRYRITAVLGKGGFGKVYRAVLEGPGGFHKDVAIKLLKDRDVPELTLQRFRDEARILGLVRDRAIVNVDPPTRLAGRWAVVMEYVEGASIQRLMSLGPIPASVASEIVQEVARVLDKVFRTAGPDGEPLRILHRDVKPANIQLTSDGEVKVLDFGIAKAEFSAREAHTSAYIGGTRGYIAPERLEGVDSPAGDVYSLGVTLHFMVSGERLTKRQAMGLDDPDTLQLGADARAMLGLASRMRSSEPDQRPTAREVEELCAQIRRRSDGPSLREWAEELVPRAVALKYSDAMVGSVLSETLSVAGSQPRLADGHDLAELNRPTPMPAPLRVRVARPRRRRMRWMLGFLAMGMTAGAGLIVVVGVAAVAVVVLGPALSVDRGQPLPPLPSPAVRPADPVAVAPVAPVQAAPAPVVPVQAVPAPAVPAPAVSAPAVQPDPAVDRPAPAPEPAPEPIPRPRPEPVSAAPAPAPDPAPDPAPSLDDVPDRWLTFSSVPLGADVYLDGALIGRTPLMDVPVPEGVHTVKMVSTAETIVRDITVGRRNPERFVWKGGDVWELHF